MKIAVIGVYYSANLGDGIICESVAWWLKKAFPQADIEIIDKERKKSFSPQIQVSLRILQYRKLKLAWENFLTRTGINDRIYYWNKVDVDTRQEFYDEIGNRGYDAVIFAGGQLFMDWLSMDICEFLKRFEQKNIPVFFNACGVGFSISKNIQRNLGKHLRNENIKLISTRDDAEAVEKRYLNGEKKVIETYDPALYCKEVYGQGNRKTDMLGLGIMYSTHAGLRKLTTFWINIIKELQKRQIKWKMFCNGSVDDYNYGCYILCKFGLKKEQYMLDYPKYPQELVRQITFFDKIISFRLHSHIVAAAYDIPAVAIVWDDKLRSFYRRINCEERCRTIEDSPKLIVDTLLTAGREGYDRTLLEEQKSFSCKLLISKIKEEMLHE